jgi:hypothetical protein
MNSRIATLVLLGLVANADAKPKKKAPPKKPPAGAKDKQTPEQKEADRHFKSGVALFKEAKFAEALAEFERAYEIAPHPLVLYNIAGCHRELSHYSEAVKFYKRFLDEAKDQAPKERLKAAQAELDGILARIARITVAAPDGAMLTVDGAEVGTMPVEMPLMVAPGEHKIIVRSQGMRDAEKTVRVASGDVIDVAMKLVELPARPSESVVKRDDVDEPTRKAGQARRKWLGVGAAFGTNLRQAADTGAPTLGLSVALASRFELGVDAIMVAYAVMPSVRVRLFGDAIAVHAAVAAPVSFKDGDMKETFVAGAVGLGVRLRPAPFIAVRLESFASFAGKDHGTTVPAFVGGELWF